MLAMSGPSSASLTPGTQFGAYQIVKSLGHGAAGDVYEVFKSSVGKRMALKVLHHSLLDSEDDLLRFEREAFVTGTIEHPNIVQVYDIGEHEGHRFMAMEFLEGETLEDKLRREGTLTIRELADLFVPLLSALGVVHDRGIVHRDLKPGNIFLANRRHGRTEAKLLDFGIIKDLSGIVGGDMTKAHAMVGSPSYMSPEQSENPKAIDVRSDIFTLGSILWECLVGSRLFDGESLYQILFKIADAPIQNPRSIRHDVPEDLDALIMRALERDPEKRLSSAREMGALMLAHCSEQVCTTWRVELMAALGDDMVDEMDGATKMISTVNPSDSFEQSPQRISHPSQMSSQAPQRISHPSLMSSQAPSGVMLQTSSQAPAHAYPNTLPPVSSSTAYGRSSQGAPAPMPVTSFPPAPVSTMAPAPVWASQQGAMPSPFAEHETFQPAAFATMPTAPKRSSKVIWLIAVSVLVLAAVGVMFAFSVAQEAIPPSPVAVPTTTHTTTAPAIVAAPSVVAPAVAVPVAPTPAPNAVSAVDADAATSSTRHSSHTHRARQPRRQTKIF
jgi:eukaryotic-like serine/threonine-protein kinase